MSLEGVYDDGNVFAKILRGEVPSAKVFENAETLAFMDVFPQTRGHTLVISKTSRARNLLEIEPEALNAVMVTVRRVAWAVKAALNPDGILISQFNGAAAGQTIYHLHVHILPRWIGVEVGRHGAGEMADIGELTDLARRIAAKIDNEVP